MTSGQMVQSLGDYRVPQIEGFSKPRYIAWRLVLAPFFRLTPDVRSCDRLRSWLLRRGGAKIGRGVVTRPNVRVYLPWNLEIADNCWIGDRVTLYSLGKIELGSNVCISQGCFLNTGSHDHSDPAFNLLIRPIVIEEQSWVGANCFVNLGVRIGKGTVIGASSNVVKDIPSGVIAYGNPCEPRGLRNKKLGLGDRNSSLKL